MLCASRDEVPREVDLNESEYCWVSINQPIILIQIRGQSLGIIIRMSLKWTHSQDILLHQSVHRFGTDWHKIELCFHKKRSRNALIKRWHNKLKLPLNDTQTSQRDLQANDELPLSFADSPLEDPAQVQVFWMQDPNPAGFSANWNETQDNRLRQLVLTEHIYDWVALSDKMGVPALQIRRYWELSVYPTIKSQYKIAGAVLWTPLQDAIILNAIPLPDIRWESLLAFLPGRSYFSLQARWKRFSQSSHINKTSEDSGLIRTQPIITPHQRRLMEYRRVIRLRKRAERRSRGRRGLNSSQQNV